MSSRSKRKRDRRAQQTFIPDAVREDSDGIHTAIAVPGQPPPDIAQRATEEFQKQIRNSPMWEQMVAQYGEAEAERLLKKCKAEVR